MTLDGFVAKKDGDSDWVSPLDSAIFEKKIKEMGCLIVGRKTFDQYQGDLYPVSGVTNIVLTSNSSIKSKHPNVFYASSPKDATSIAQAQNHDRALLIGGGTNNGLFLKANLIDEVYLTVYPLVFGEGIKLFEKLETNVKLKLLDQKLIDAGLIHLHYQVIK